MDLERKGKDLLWPRKQRRCAAELWCEQVDAAADGEAEARFGDDGQRSGAKMSQGRRREENLPTSATGRRAVPSPSTPPRFPSSQKSCCLVTCLYPLCTPSTCLSNLLVLLENKMNLYYLRCIINQFALSLKKCHNLWHQLEAYKITI